jgi:hypothetical protein
LIYLRNSATSLPHSEGKKGSCFET